MFRHTHFRRKVKWLRSRVPLSGFWHKNLLLFCSGCAASRVGRRQDDHDRGRAGCRRGWRATAVPSWRGDVMLYARRRGMFDVMIQFGWRSCWTRRWAAGHSGRAGRPSKELSAHARWLAQSSYQVEVAIGKDDERRDDTDDQVSDVVSALDVMMTRETRLLLCKQSCRSRQADRPGWQSLLGSRWRKRWRRGERRWHRWEGGRGRQTSYARTLVG